MKNVTDPHCTNFQNEIDTYTFMVGNDSYHCVNKILNLYMIKRSINSPLQSVKKYKPKLHLQNNYKLNDNFLSLYSRMTLDIIAVKPILLCRLNFLFLFFLSSVQNAAHCAFKTMLGSILVTTIMNWCIKCTNTCTHEQIYIFKN